MGVSSRLVPGPVPVAARPRAAAEVSVERENVRFPEPTLVAFGGLARESCVQVLKDFVDLERRVSSALDIALRVCGAVVAGGAASRASWVDVEYDVPEIHYDMVTIPARAGSVRLVRRSVVAEGVAPAAAG